jgi:hypothetical protein
MTKIANDYYADHATPDELRAILGPGWKITRRTSGHQNPITRRQYEAAERLALSHRT